MKRSKPGICGLCFHSPGCGVIVHFDENDRIVNLEPDPEAPLGKVLCPIGAYVPSTDDGANFVIQDP